MEDLFELASLVEDSLKSGLRIESIKSSLMLTEHELKSIEKTYPHLKMLQRTAQLQDYNEVYEMTKMGNISASLYTHRSKTLWRNFYPQAEDTTDKDRILESANTILDVIAKKSLA